jgi:hypothetical protein
MIHAAPSQPVEPNPHVLGVQVAAPPVLDPPYTLSGLLYSRVESAPDVPLIGYPSTPSGAADYVFYTPRQVNRFAKNAAFFLRNKTIEPHVSYKTPPSVTCND